MTDEQTAERESMTLGEIGDRYGAVDEQNRLIADADAIRGADDDDLAHAADSLIYRGAIGHGYNGPNADWYDAIYWAVNAERRRRREAAAEEERQAEEYDGASPGGMCAPYAAW